LKKIKTAWSPPSAARSEPRVDRVQNVPTALRQRLPPPCRANSTAAAASPPPVSAASHDFKKSTPPMSLPFRPSSSARNQPLLLTPYQRQPLCPSVASSSSTPRRCTFTTSPTPAPTTPPAPHRCSSPLDTCHRGAPSPVRFPLLRTPNQTPHEPGIVLGYFLRLPVLPVHRIPAGAAAVRHEPSPPCFW
jgi:hypothetical protein